MKKEAVSLLYVILFIYFTVWLALTGRIMYLLPVNPLIFVIDVVIFGLLYVSLTEVWKLFSKKEKHGRKAKRVAWKPLRRKNKRRKRKKEKYLFENPQFKLFRP
jgi:hypothetical protein